MCVNICKEVSKEGAEVEVNARRDGLQEFVLELGPVSGEKEMARKHRRAGIGEEIQQERKRVFCKQGRGD